MLDWIRNTRNTSNQNLELIRYKPYGGPAEKIWYDIGGKYIKVSRQLFNI